MLNIRTFRPADAGAVRLLFAQSLIDFAGNAAQTVESYVESSLADDLADISIHYLRSPGDHFWVAEAEGQIKGMVGIQRRDEGEAELRRMSVARDARRQGIGWALLETTESFCREQGYQQIRLTTVTLLQPAIAMYTRFGYRLTGEDQYGEIAAQHFVKLLDDPRPEPVQGRPGS
jgi:GNAT superfamily N-acetyltransferase